MASKVCIATRRLTDVLRLRRRPAVTTALTYTLTTDRPVEEEQIPEYDSTHFCPVVPGQTFNGRYEAISKLGWGTTSTVWLARDLRRYARLSPRRGFGPLLSPVVTPRIADFGLAQEVNDGGTPLIHPIQPDHYRAPEVIVGGSWDYSVDIWNFGVMIWSLAGNTELFQPVSTSHGRYSAAKHLAQMTALLGPAPPAFVARQAKGQEWRWRPAIPNDAGKLCDQVSEYFGGPFFDPETGEFLYQHLIPENATLAESIGFIDKEEEKVEFMRFIRQMLQWEPEKRKTARELFDDPWLVNAPRRDSSGTKVA